MIRNSYSRRVRPGIIGALTLCLSLAGCLAAKHGFGGVGFRVIPSGLPLYQAQETVPDETEFPGAEYSSSSCISAVIARYFDMQLGLGELHPERPSNPYMRTEDADSSGWAFQNGTANTALWLRDPKPLAARDLDRDPLESFASPGSVCVGWLLPGLGQSIPMQTGDLRQAGSQKLNVTSQVASANSAKSAP
jgi:hypothetical protein